jgi:hypothetical protein
MVRYVCTYVPGWQSGSVSSRMEGGHAVPLCSRSAIEPRAGSMRTTEFAQSREAAKPLQPDQHDIVTCSASKVSQLYPPHSPKHCAVPDKRGSSTISFDLFRTTSCCATANRLSCRRRWPLPSSTSIDSLYCRLTAREGSDLLPRLQSILIHANHNHMYRCLNASPEHGRWRRLCGLLGSRPRPAINSIAFAACCSLLAAHCCRRPTCLQPRPSPSSVFATLRDTHARGRCFTTLASLSAAPPASPHRGRSVRALSRTTLVAAVRQIINRRLTNPPPSATIQGQARVPCSPRAPACDCLVPFLWSSACSSFAPPISCVAAPCHSLRPTLRVSSVGLKELSNPVWFARYLQTALRSSRRHL